MAVKQWIKIFAALMIIFFSLPLYATNDFECSSRTSKMRVCDAAMATVISNKYSGTPAITSCQLFPKVFLVISSMNFIFRTSAESFRVRMCNHRSNAYYQIVRY